jgi:hypothetical protein
MNNGIEFKVTYKGEAYAFGYGSEVYIFHTGIYNDIDTKHGIGTLLQYTALVHDCYLSDSNRTPLGELADYVAENWDKLNGSDRYDILEKFYDTLY